jgi:hypothetical protein
MLEGVKDGERERCYRGKDLGWKREEEDRK